MFRAMTPGQYASWKRYYWEQRGSPHTRHQTLKTGRCAVVDGGSRHIGYYAFWMRRTAKYDLADFLARYLGAGMEVLDVQDTAEGVWLLVKITKAREGYYKWEPGERAFLRVR